MLKNQSYSINKIKINRKEPKKSHLFPDLFQLFDVYFHGLFFTHVSVGLPRLILGPAHHVPETGLGDVAGPRGGLFVEPVELLHHGVGRLIRAFFGQALDDFEGGFELDLNGHGALMMMIVMMMIFECD